MSSEALIAEARDIASGRWRPQGADLREVAEELADALEAAGRDKREAQAEAWAEGFDAGHYTGDEPRDCECKINPYLNGDNK